jgi:hypothetical protein
MSLRSTSKQTLCFDRDRVSLMGGLVKHGGEAEKLACRRLVHYDFLLVFIHGGDPHRAGNQDVGFSARVADLPYALTHREVSEFNLSRQHCGLFVVEQSKQGNTSQNFGAACHRTPRELKWTGADPFRRMS